MKKKGLIISTVVMVVVLIASLTTATYAWFNVSQTTSIDGFVVSVNAGNVMNIGLNAAGNTSYNAATSADGFVSGACTYTGGEAGQFATGYWTGNPGLGAQITHDIVWGAQSKAVGFSSVDLANFATATYANTGYIGTTDGSALTTPWQSIIAANGTKTTMGTPTKANANKTPAAAEGGEATSGDFVYMFLGAQPTTKIQAGTNVLHVVIQPQGLGTTIGMAAAIHVAYKVNASENCKDVDAFGTKHYTDARSGSATVNGEIVTTGFTGATYNGSTKQTTITNAVTVDIPLTNWDGTGAAPLDQIQLVIYIAGRDEDCVDAAKNGTIKIGLFFGAQEAANA